MNLPILPIFIAGLATMPIGFLWFSPFLFAHSWMKMSKIHPQHVKNGPGAFPFVVSLFSGVVMAFMLSLLITMMKIPTLQGAWKLGLLLWFAFDFVPGWMQHLFDRRPLGLLLINSGHTAANILLIGWILMLWK